ncbi:hypothetical protein FH972_019932 [Carpinus fangiana]|uniref:Uncharacterized protein n=1 Tax=Carpinus fangiana TaxID=176857 RepID=A0A5N6RT74_9ROSI|nr:hypothetical protein FH972_019932 [Carpinus fangiana]
MEASGLQREMPCGTVVFRERHVIWREREEALHGPPHTSSTPLLRRPRLHPSTPPRSTAHFKFEFLPVPLAAAAPHHSLSRSWLTSRR